MRACAPVPLSGQSSRVPPSAASCSRACSLTAIGSVLASTTTRSGRPPFPSSLASAVASPSWPATTSPSAAAEGSEVITTGARAATARLEAAACPPLATSASTRAAARSWPTTV
ncbi:MAG TPA: hypothetical protein VF995_05940 [Actinomycetota bacterium]